MGGRCIKFSSSIFSVEILFFEFQAGEYTNGTNCIPCEKGSYCPTTSSSPVSCAAGTYANVTGMSSCIVCPPGYHCIDPAISPVICPEGTFSIAGQTICEVSVDIHRFIQNKNTKSQSTTF